MRRGCEVIVYLWSNREFSCAPCLHEPIPHQLTEVLTLCNAVPNVVIELNLDFPNKSLLLAP